MYYLMLMILVVALFALLICLDHERALSGWCSNRAEARQAKRNRARRMSHMKHMQTLR